MNKKDEKSLVHFKPWRVATSGCLGALSFILSSVSYGEMNLGTKGALAFGVDGDVQYDSNISQNSDEVDDVIVSVTPKLLYRYDRGFYDVDAYLGLNVTRYDSESQYDSESLLAGVMVQSPTEDPDRNYDYLVSVSYKESTQADADLQSIIERETFRFKIASHYYFTDRYYIHPSFEYLDRSVVTEGFDDIETITIPTVFYYRYSENLQFGIGYGFRDTHVANSGPTADSQDHSIFGSIKADFIGNLDAEVNVGVQHRNYENSDLDDDDALYMDTTLGWDVSERTRIELTAGNQFDTSATSNSLETMFVEIGVAQRFNEKLKATSSLRYEEREYEALTGSTFREDEKWSVNFGAEYALIEDRLTLSGALSFSDQNSDAAQAEYDRTMVKIGLSYIF